MKSPAAKLNLFAWVISTAVTVTAIAVWGQGTKWQFSGLSTYRLFPIFGLLAFSLMWVMAIVRSWRLHLGVKASQTKTYYKSASLAVITLILLHPALLIWQLWRDGFGLPPGSYLQHYVAPSLKWAAVLSTAAFFVFLAYELRRKYRQQAWWKYLEHAQAGAMIIIFWHGLQFGSDLQHGWYRWVWYFYGAVLALVLLDFYTFNFKKVDLADKKAV